MNPFKTFALILLVALAGCKKKEDAPSASNEAIPQVGTTAVTQAESPQTLPPAPSYIAAQAENSVQSNVTGEPDQFLTSQLRIFVKDKGRLPQSFTEFARTRLDSMPPAPAGTKWVIDSASAEVKAAKK